MLQKDSPEKLDALPPSENNEFWGSTEKKIVHPALISTEIVSQVEQGKKKVILGGNFRVYKKA